MLRVEPGNFYDTNTVVVEKDGRIIDHLPQKRPCSISEARLSRSMYCEWKTVGKTAGKPR